MHYSSTIFGQLLAFIPKKQLQTFIREHGAERYVKKVTAWNHLAVLLYAQATGKDSLREIETSLQTCRELWHHVGVRSVARSSIGRTNNARDPIVFEKLFYALLADCQTITPPRRFSFKNPLYSLDATLVSLCLNLFDWAKYRTGKGACKMHAVLDNRTGIPTVIAITPGNVADITAGRDLSIDLPAQSILVFDRGYVDYAWWKQLDRQKIFWVTRAKTSMVLITAKRRTPHGDGILADDIVWLGDALKDVYGKEIRCVRYRDATQGELIFFTNNMDLSASQIALVCHF